MKVLILLISSLISVCLQAQQYQIDIKKSLTSTELFTSRGRFWHLDSIENLRGVPSGLDTIFYWTCPLSAELFNEEQIQNRKYYGRYKEEQTPINENSISLDTSIKASHNLTKNVKYKINALTALKNGKKIIIVDTNNNNDLSDEIVMEFDTTMSFNERLSSYTKTPFMIINYELPVDEEILNFEKVIRIRPLINYLPPPNKLIEDLSISIVSNEIYTGTISVFHNMFNISVIEPFVKTRDNAGDLNIKIMPYSVREDSLNLPIMSTLGEPVKLEDNLYIQFDSVDFVNKKIWFSHLPNYSPFGFGTKEGMTAPVFVGIELIGGYEIGNNIPNQKKFTLLYFWGTWCGPCKRDHPKLKKLFDQYEKDVKFIGLAADKNDVVVKEFIIKNNIPWPNIFLSLKDYSQKNEEITNKFHIDGFPSYILLDRDNKVVVNSMLNHVENYLKNH